jgi:sterol desaturase/sphingolipid hydroxylase (fatty acid hydroxylase superfamily)
MGDGEGTESTRERSWLRALWDGEIRVRSERHRRLADAYVVFFAITFAIGFLGLMHHTAYLGPGLGDDPSVGPFAQLWQAAGRVGPPLPFVDPLREGAASLAQLALVVLVVANVAATAAIILGGYFRFERVFGQKYPLDQLWTFALLAALNSAAITVMLAGLAGLAALFGVDFVDGFFAFDRVLVFAREQAQELPTLVHLPPFLAFLLIYNVGGFFHYWAHRLGHESRVLWLLFHRHHHMNYDLTQPTSQPVFFAFPLFVVLAVPYVFAFAAVAKLFTDDPLAVASYTILFKLVAAFATTFSHQSALYDVASRSRFVRVLGQLVSEGPYHYLHHSAEPAEHSRRGNVVNVGGGMVFLWDRVFGTFRDLTARRPAVGLEGSPRLHLNPLRLALSGVAQLGVELANNRTPSAWLRILLGGADHRPTVSRDFAIRADR